MRGGIPDKLGNRYEQDYVVLQYLRLLVGENLSVRWESWDPEEAGVDLFLRDGRGEIAIQCKHRAPGETWKPGRLAREILPHARRWLDRGPDHRFLLVADREAPELERVSDSAREVRDPETWWSSFGRKESKILEGLGLPVGAAGVPVFAHEILGRIQFELLTPESIARESRASARLLTLDRVAARRLLERLEEIAWGQLGGTPLRAEELRSLVESAGLTLVRGGSGVGERLTELAHEFRRSVEWGRGPVPLLPRVETEELWRRLSLPEGPVRIVVHGPAGSGKSEVLAALAQRVTDEGWVPLAISAADPRISGDLPSLGLGPDPVGALLLHAAGAPVVLILDQLDSVLWAGAETHHLVRPVRSLIERGGRLGIPIVVGCRSVDSRSDTQLRLIVDGAGPGTVVEIPVEDLSESQYAAVLGESGIALQDLPPPIRRLAARPLHLKLIMALHEAGVRLDDVRSWPTLVQRWWQWVETDLRARGHPRGRAVFDALVEKMQREGSLVVRPGDLPEDDLAALSEAGVVVLNTEPSGRFVRASHQILADVAAAQRLTDSEDPADLLRRLGGRERQGVHTAGQVRLAVPFLRERPDGTGFLRSLMGSEDVRPLVKHGLLRGLAEAERPSVEEVELLCAWLDDPALRGRVLWYVVRGSADWVRALERRGWFEQELRRDDREVRRQILDLLASVARRQGDVVAGILADRAREDPGILEDARWVFLQEPVQDTDDFFEVRLQSLQQGRAEEIPHDWTTLLGSHPVRAARLLAVLLPRLNSEDLCQRQVEWAMQFPERDSSVFADAAREGARIWEILREWWSGLDAPETYGIRMDAHPIPDCLLARVVELLARSLAHVLAAGGRTWPGLLADLPESLRAVDAWLLLRVGASLPDGAMEVADEAAAWFLSEEEWRNFSIGFGGGSYDLAVSFVERVATLASDESYSAFEEGIRTWSDPWSLEDERRRWRLFREDGWGLAPNLRGALAYHLLPALPVSRRSEKARALLDRLKRKFDSEREWCFGGVRSCGGTVVPDVPLAAAAGWDTEEWLRQLRSAPERGHFVPAGPDRIESHDRRTMAGLLEAAVRRDPGRYVALARAMDESVYARARGAMLDALRGLEPPEDPSSGREWVPVDSADLEQVLVLPAYLREERCVHSLQRIVEERAEHPWSEAVLRRLEEMAEGPIRGVTDGRADEDLLFERLNEEGCGALRALGRVATLQPGVRSRVLDLAERAARQETVIRRTSAGLAAWSAREENPDRADGLLVDVAADPLVAADPDICQRLLWLACHERQAAARDRLLAVARSPESALARTGGQILVSLRWNDAVDDKCFESLLVASLDVRRGAAHGVARALLEAELPDWLRRLAVRLANDDDDEVAEPLARAFGSRGGDALFEDEEFLSEFASSRAVRRWPFHFLHACDRATSLRPMGENLIAVAAEMADSPPGLHEARALDLRTACGMLARLVEEAGRVRDPSLRARALDAWDRLLESEAPFAAEQLDARFIGAE